VCLETDFSFHSHRCLNSVEYTRVYDAKNIFLYRADTKYTVNVSGMFEGGESMPLAGEENTTYSDEPDSPPMEAPSKVFYHKIRHYMISGVQHHCKTGEEHVRFKY